MEFRRQVEVISGQNVNLCYQCSKCSAGCPLAKWMDLKPAQVMHSIRLGRDDSVLNSEAIWLCLACETCATRCPQGVDPAAAMTAARVIAIRRGIRPRVREIGVYYKGFIDNMRLNGKIHDASLVAVTRILNGQMLSDLSLAWKLFIRGRVKPPPLPLHGSSFRKLFRNANALESGTKQ